MKFKVFILTICLLFCNVLISKTNAIEKEEITIPKDAIILSQTETSIYYNLNTSNKFKTTLNDELFEIKCKHTWYQEKNGKISVGIKCIALNHKAKIKKIVGTHKAKDTQSYASETSEVRAMKSMPNYFIEDYVNGTTKFTKNHKVKCTLKYYITLSNGSVLNGGKITNSTTITIVR